MPYAFKFEAFNRDPTSDEAGYSRKLSEVEVTVIADGATEAEDMVSKLIERSHYNLESITEMSDSLWAVGQARW